MSNDNISAILDGISDDELFVPERRCIGCGISCEQIMCAKCEWEALGERQREVDRRLGEAVRDMFARAIHERCTRCGGCGEEPSILPEDRDPCGTCRGTGKRITLRISQQWFEAFNAEALRKERGR